MKKFISFLLSLTLVFSLAVPCFAAEDAEEYPTVYVIGAHKNEIFNAKDEKIYPIEADIGARIKEAIIPCLEKLAIGMLTDDYEEYAEEFNSAMAPIFEELILDKNGDVSNGSYTMYYSSTENIIGKTSGYSVWDGRFWYDWRESPIKTAGELKLHIDNVISATGKDKVQLIGRCYGANVIAAYLELYKEHAIKYVSDVSYYSSSALGIDFMSAIYSGEIYLDDVAITNFLNYYVENEDLFEDESTGVFVQTFVEVLRYAKVLGLAGDALTDFFNKFKDDLLPLVIRNSFGGWLSYWAMVTPELYEKARDYIFGTEELKSEYEGFIAKADKYHYDVQVNIVDTMVELDKAGINFYNFTKYNFPEIPIYKGAHTQGDADTSVYRQSFGATAADYGKVLSEKYLASVPAEKLKYISPDRKIDASTCLFPDKTWFIKDLHHDFFSPLQNMSMEIMRYDLTVENEKYPQFLTHIGKGDVVVDELIITEGTDEDADKEESTYFTVLIRFFTAFFNFIRNILKGGISFSE